MVAAIQLKRYMTDACIFGIIIRKLSHRQESCPVILFKVNESLEIYLYCFVLSFGLTVCLRMKRG